MIEELSKKLSLRLTEKLGNNKISIEEMVIVIDEFLRLVSTADEEKLKVFISRF
jgi:hypothetical protein